MPPTALLRYTDEAGEHTLPLDRDEITLGRADGQDIVVREQCVSRRHAAVVREGEAHFAVDHQSTLGTFVNGVRIERKRLRPGDVLQLGSPEATRIVFEPAPGAPASNPSSSVSSRGTVIFQALTSVKDFERLNWLLDAVRQLNMGGPIDEILAGFLQLTLQLTGLARGFVFLAEEGKQPMRLAAGRAATGEALAEDATLSQRAMQQAATTSKKFFVTDTLAEANVAGWQSVVINNIRSIYCLPLRRRNTQASPQPGHPDLLGVLYLDSHLGIDRMTNVDHELLDTIATEAAGLVENAVLAQAEEASREARRELTIAANIHSGLMANELPTVPYARIQAVSRPCLEIGGDFYDAIALPDCLCVTLADVSGKGVSAAIVAATLQGILYAQVTAGQPLAQIAAHLNRFLCARRIGKYATLVMLKIFPDGSMEYMNCGHIPPIVAGHGHARALDQGNLIVGLIPTATYESTRIQLAPGERVILVTDGVTEAENEAGDPFGDGHLTHAACGCTLHEILAEVSKFSAGAPASDDCTLLEISYTGNA
ncbi:SpoIIE family protein phosphatase [Granulicella tundricola]|uniref:Protein serine/threonine phosphatase with GAF(S) sensor(S) n=1 Tax=Granulicella tundricola (strain ATCC BAA-1859 / DSM 23138 / MP5ACTX9) TaxID=1198114 RepID=E8WZ71_GRATM|nr:SpoIIE family protein phosphatase [Granulicella tundricola]ADW67673.1 protein serine/threonine phosphatase with GAF(s) sensor(s) [Granulicella tundricola MP5ACTX9]